MKEGKVLPFFRDILRIPRESGHEEHMIEYLMEFGRSRNLDTKRDAIGNVLITKPAAKGCESWPTVVLQSHQDMVCEKNGGVKHDFAKDAIKAYVKDGWMKAEGTTLGADDGIGIASELAILDDPDLKLGKIECLFTISEETGLDGANALEPGFFTGKILINLDSEDWGQLFIGCAGGIDTTATFKYVPWPMPEGLVAAKFSISGGIGGHSGDDIDKGRANAVQLLARFLYVVLGYEIELCEIDGGNKRNAIAREASATIAFDPECEDDIIGIFNRMAEAIADEYSVTDPGIVFSAEPVTWKGDIIDTNTAYCLIAALNAAPHGVLAMSAAVKGLVETSTNLASVKMLPDNEIRIGSSQRSAINSARRAAADRVEACFALAGAEVSHEGEYPGWKPNTKSPILKTTVDSYKRLFGKKPIVRAIHAGLECGLFQGKYPDLDMISFGPTILGVHSPDERLELATVDKFWDLLIDVLQHLA
ncbi:MAG: aminoacyl-histidine dipeptidase [Bacteroidales bacterium]|nr:aminoacyl-histidine dipeptidase [Bacteroidales bacterium]